MGYNLLPWATGLKPAPVPPVGSFVTFFWDYDTQWGADRSRAGRGPRQYGHLEFENTEPLLELLDEFGIQACFAVVGAAALPGSRPYHDPQQIRKIHHAGHEIASHSFRHEWIPALDPKALRETLHHSKDALEQCISAEVNTFVPPFNQPFDCPERLAFSLSERREVRRDRTGLATLCRALRESDYKLTRVSYRSLKDHVLGRIMNRQTQRPSHLERIAGFPCLRLNTPGGFDFRVAGLVRANLAKGGIWVIYGHPHSATEDGNQSLACLRTLFEEINQWRKAGHISCVRPIDLLQFENPKSSDQHPKPVEIEALRAR
jgi:hypothetical protein